MAISLLSPSAGLIRDILLLSTLFLFVTGFGMLITLKVWDYLIVRKRRKQMMGRNGLPLIQ